MRFLALGLCWLQSPQCSALEQSGGPYDSLQILAVCSLESLRVFLREIETPQQCYLSQVTVEVTWTTAA